MDVLVQESFRLGTLVVRPRGEGGEAKATFLDLEKFPKKVEGDTTYEYEGLRANRRLTVVGEVYDGTMAGGAVFLVSTLPTRQELLDSQHEDVRATWALSAAALGLGGLTFLLGVVAFFRRR